MENQEHIDLSNLNINDIDIHKADFIYDCGISLLKEIEDGNKVITTRSTLFIGYLLGLFTFYSKKITELNGFINIQTWIYIILCLICIITAITLFYICLIPKATTARTHPPKIFLKNETLTHKLELIKIGLCVNIQRSIDNSIKDQLIRHKVFKYSFALVLSSQLLFFIFIIFFN